MAAGCRRGKERPRVVVQATPHRRQRHRARLQRRQQSVEGDIDQAVSPGQGLCLLADQVAELPEQGLRSTELAAAAGDCDLAVIVTAHPGIDWRELADRAPMLLDLRGVTRGIDATNVRRLGEGAQAP